MAAYGVGAPDIASVLDISAPTLRKYFWRELELGAVEANAKVAESLFQRATSKDAPQSVTAAIFWLKARAGWTDQPNEGAPGKKEIALKDAETAGRNSDWGNDLSGLN